MRRNKQVSPNETQPLNKRNERTNEDNAETKQHKENQTKDNFEYTKRSKGYKKSLLQRD